MAGRKRNKFLSIEDEKDLLLAGETIYIAGKEVFFELEDGMLYLTLKVENSSENQYSIIYITPRIGGIPEIQSYEEYINPRQVLAGKTEAEKEQIFVDFEITNWGSYYESYYPGEEITLDLILESYGVSSFEDLVKNEGYNSIDELLINWEYIERDKYQQYYDDYQMNYAKNITITKHDGSTIAGDNMNSYPCVVLENGTYTISAEYDGNVVNKTVKISGIGESKEKFNLAKLDENTYKIDCIEDLIKFSENVNSGVDYKEKKITLTKSLDFNDNSSYQNPLDTETFGDYNGDGIVEGIKAEVTKDIEKGFVPIGGKTLYIRETYETIYYSFKGVFNGNNHEINNIYIQDKDNLSQVGLLGCNYGTVKDLTVDGEYILGNTQNYVSIYVGGITAKNYGNIENCNNKVEFDVKGNGYIYLGGITGSNIKANLTNCKNYSNITIDENCQSNYVIVGGIIGHSENYTSKNKNCINNGNITIKNKTTVNVGGIVGELSRSGRFINCLNNGFINVQNITNYADVGGIARYQKYGGLWNCLNRGDINVEIGTFNNEYNGYYIGGISGEAVEGKDYILLNVGNVKVTANEYLSNAHLGGGLGDKYYAAAYDIYNIGEVTGININNNKCGVIAGVGYGDAVTGGYKENLGPSRAVANQPNWLPNSMELNANILKSLLNEATLTEKYLDECEESSLAQWIIDESVSTEYPILELQ